MCFIRKAAAYTRLVSRRKEVRRILRRSTLLRKHLVRSTVMSVLPSEIADITIHHAPFDIVEVSRVISDCMVTGIIGMALAMSMMALQKQK